MNTREQILRKEIEESFGCELTVKQLWTLVKLSKHVRLRCRNNSAFNNYMNALFRPHATFNTVTKSRISRITGRPETYPGLSIVINGQEHNETDEGELEE